MRDIREQLEVKITAVDARSGKLVTAPLWQFITEEYSLHEEFYGRQLYGKRKEDLRTGKDVRKCNSYPAATFRPYTIEDVTKIEDLMDVTPAPVANKGNNHNPLVTAPWLDNNRGKDIKIHAMCRQMLRAYGTPYYKEATEGLEHDSSDWLRVANSFSNYYRLSLLDKGLVTRPF